MIIYKSIWKYVSNITPVFLDGLGIGEKFHMDKPNDILLDLRIEPNTPCPSIEFCVQTNEAATEKCESYQRKYHDSVPV